MSTATLPNAAIQRAQRLLTEGQAHLGARKSRQALRCFLDALKILPDVAVIHGLIGDALNDLGRTEDAIQSYRRALAVDSEQLAIWNNLGNALRRLSRFTEAMGCYDRALRLAPQHPVIWKNLGLCFQYENQPDAAVDCMRRAQSFAPNQLKYTWCQARVLPITYADTGQRDTYRKRYTEGLQRVHEMAKVDPDPSAIWDAFHLHYQGQNDRQLQELHGRTIHAIMAQTLPKYTQPLAPRSHDGTPIRVGFASSMLTKHTISFLFGDWLAELAKRGFEVYGYLVGEQPDVTTKKLSQSCAAFRVLPQDTERCADNIIKDELDVLIYPELGMNRHLLKLAALRLAPTQAVTWGHPVTTGLPTIDVFLSSDAMEPPDGDAHYSERLLRLPGLSLCLNQLPRPKYAKRREDFGLPQNGPLFLIPQSLFKLTPEHDWIYGDIAKNVPDAHFCFIANAAAQSTSGATQTVKSRLERVFASATPHAPRFTFLPGQSHEDFLALNQCSDIFLDAPGWSGGRTTLEGLGCGIIPISCPGPMMRQRHTAAILQELGWPELIAASPQEYVSLATRLAVNEDWRTQLKAELPNRIEKLLHRQDVADVLAEFCASSRHQ